MTIYVRQIHRHAFPRVEVKMPGFPDPVPGDPHRAFLVLRHRSINLTSTIRKNAYENEKAADMTDENVLRNGFSRECPSSQTALDIFSGSWWTAMPADSGLVAGLNPGFDDARVPWVNSLVPLAGARIVELGPFEAYTTWQLQQHAVADLVSVEANRYNFLKCLVIKEIFDLKAKFVHGDVCKFLESTDEQYDFVWASGIVYHNVDPLRLLQLASQRSDRIFIWTHYYDEQCASSPTQGYLFNKELNSTYEFSCVDFTYHFRSYGMNDFDNMPNHWSAGTALHANWLSRDDLIKALNILGYKNIAVQVDGVRLDDLPVISLLASR